MSNLLLGLLGGTRVPWGLRIVYIVPHQDDEVLTYGASILADVEEGYTVEVVLATRGQASVARTNPTLVNRLGYTPTLEQFSAARDREFIAAVERMGATPVVLPYAQRQPDGGSTAAGVEAVARAAVPGGADLVCGIAPSDPAADHRNTGHAAAALVASGWAAEARMHVAWYNKAGHSSPALQTRGLPITRFHQNPYIEYDISEGMWGVGYISVPDLFDGQLSDPLSYHYPYVASGSAVYGTAV